MMDLNQTKLDNRVKELVGWDFDLPRVRNQTKYKSGLWFAEGSTSNHWWNSRDTGFHFGEVVDFYLLIIV